MNKITSLLLLIICFSCTHSSETEKYQNKRDNIVNVNDKVQEFVIDDILMGSVLRLYFMGDYLLIEDSRSYDKLVHIFDKKKLKYCTSTVDRGPGPYEITSLGHLEVDEIHNKFYLSDYSKLKIFSFDLDSVLADPFYRPHVKLKMNGKQIPSQYIYVNDTLCIAKIIEPIGNNDFKPTVGKWNMSTGEIVLMKYEHPEIKKKRCNFNASIENGIYVEIYNYHDLMSICSLNGELKYNIYGPDWSSETDARTNYYCHASICGDMIVALYSGEDAFFKDKNGELKSNPPTKFLVFDLKGNYIKTLETEHQICDFYYDKENHRFIMTLNEEIQFAYLDLEGLI
jgi:hypothetical protein